MGDHHKYGNLLISIISFATLLENKTGLGKTGLGNSTDNVEL